MGHFCFLNKIKSGFFFRLSGPHLFSVLLPSQKSKLYNNLVTPLDLLNLTRSLSADPQSAVVITNQFNMTLHVTLSGLNYVPVTHTHKDSYRFPTLNSLSCSWMGINVFFWIFLIYFFFTHNSQSFLMQFAVFLHLNVHSHRYQVHHIVNGR